MTQFKSGDTVAFKNRFNRCGHIMAIDGSKGYKINTGKDIIYGYSNELVLISANAPIRPMEAINKIDKACQKMPEYNTDFRQVLIQFLNQETIRANLFANYISKVSDEVVRACIKAISNIRIDKVDLAVIKVDGNINIQLFSWPSA